MTFGLLKLLRALLANDESLSDRLSKLEQETDQLFRIVFERLDKVESEVLIRTLSSLKEFSDLF